MFVSPRINVSSKSRKIRSALTQDYLPLFLRACLQVTLVAWNVHHIAAGDFGVAFFTGAAVSWFWWSNAKSAAHSQVAFGRVVYTLGAGTGTVLGMLLGRIL